MKNRCPLQVFWQGTGEGNSPRRKEGEKRELETLDKVIDNLKAGQGKD